MQCSLYRPRRRVDGVLRQSPIWWCNLKLSSWARPKRFSLETTDRRIASQKAQERANEEERVLLGQLPSAAAREAQARPLADLLNEYLEDVARRQTAATVRKYRGGLRKLFQVVGWRELRTVSALAFVRWSRHSGLCDKTQNDLLANARTFFSWLQANGLSAANPLEHVRPKDTRRSRPVRRALSDAEAQRLLASAPMPRRLVYWFAMRTGLRRAEIASFRWSHIEVHHGQPHLRIPAENAKVPKTVVLPLDAGLHSALLSFRHPGEPDFAQPFRRCVPRTPTLVRDLLRASIAHRDDDGRKVDFHALRMTFGTSLLARGVPLVVVKELMRHSDVRLTTKLYTDRSQLPLREGLATLATWSIDTCQREPTNRFCQERLA